MREFTTAVAQASETDEEAKKGMTFLVDGYECRAFQPKDGQLAVLMATTGRHSSLHEQIAGLINFFVAVLDKPSHTYIVNRLLDYEDDFGISEVEQIMQWMVEEWTGRPTQQPSVSTPSPPPDGQRLTLPTTASTS